MLINGWIKRDGAFISVEHGKHSDYAKTLNETEDTLIDNYGWIKITFSDFEHKQIVMWMNKNHTEPTSEQMNTLIDLGLEEFL